MPDPEPTTVDPFTWTTSSGSVEVISAFVKALKTMKDITFDAKVEAGPMRYKYATLSQVLDEVRPKLADHGLVMSQTATEVGVSTTFFHESGEWLRFPPLYIKPAGGTPQNVGSAISYARRYSILSICNLATEDDDGHAAAKAPPAAPERPAPRDTRPDRIDAVLTTLGGLSERYKAETKAWATSAGKKLSGKALFEDAEWLDEVEGYLNVLLTEIEQQTPPPGDEEPF
jgi:hypothetical protein